MTESQPNGSRDRLLVLCKRYLVVLPVALTCFAIFLAIMHHAVWQYGLDPKNIFAKTCFDLDGEGNVPAWFASVLWLLVSLACIGAYTLERAMGLKKWLVSWWLVFAVAFLVASADEVASIHENLGFELQAVLQSRGMGTTVWGFFDESPWLVFYILPIFVFAGTTLVFLSDRFFAEHRRVMFLASGGFACYLSALVIEFVQGMPDPRLEPIARFCGVTCHVFYTRTVLIEETLENLGTIAIMTAVLYYCHKLLEDLFSPSKKATVEDKVQR